MQHPRGKEVMRAEWVKAHVQVTSVLSAEDVERRTLNNFVDVRARQAAETAGPPPAAVAHYLSQLDSHVKWVRGVVHVLARWPPPPKLQRVAKGSTDACSSVAGGLPAQHQWAWGRVDAVSSEWGFRCLACLRTCRTLATRARTPC